MKQGVERAKTAAPEFLLLTDADIVYAPDALQPPRFAVAERGSRTLLLDGQVAL